MADMKRMVVRHSVEDIIAILENQPAKGDMVIYLPAVEIFNRTSLAHLSIERALKFLITEAGGPLITGSAGHDLQSRYAELRQYDPESAEFLQQAFKTAVSHYRFNHNAKGMTHLSSLRRYLETTGSNDAFQNIRYWELDQSLNQLNLRELQLWIHMEILYSLSEVLLAPQRPKETVADRVERAVKEALTKTENLSYVPGSQKEISVEGYTKWLNSHESFKDALSQAAKCEFDLGHEYTSVVSKKAYEALMEASDPAVKYFATSLDVVPKQPREIVPEVRWIDPNEKARGEVFSPGGTCLGFIDRRWDRHWFITAVRPGPLGPSAKAVSQTDARAYLALLLSKPALVKVNGEERPQRVIGNDYSMFPKRREPSQQRGKELADREPVTHELTFWDDGHGMKAGDELSVEVPIDSGGPIFQVLEGKVLEVTGSRLLVLGRYFHKISKANTL